MGYIIIMVTATKLDVSFAVLLAAVPLRRTCKTNICMCRGNALNLYKSSCEYTVSVYSSEHRENYT